MLSRLLKLLSFSMLAKLSLFFLQTLLTYILVVNDFGIFAKWMTDINLFSIFVVFGLDNSFIYFSRNKKKITLNFLRSILFYTSVVTFVFFILYLFNALSSYYVLLLFYIAGSAIYQIFNAYFLYQEKYNLYGIFSLLKTLLPLVAFCAVYLLNINISFSGAAKIFLVTLCSSILLITLVVIQDYKKNNYHVEQCFDGFLSKEYFVFGAKSVGNTFLAILLYSFTIYYISYFGSAEQIAVFFIAAAISKMMWVIPDTIGNILYPVFVKMHGSEKDSTAMEQMEYYLRVCLLLNILALVVFLLLGNYFIDLLYSESYSDSYLYVSILLIGNQGMVIYKILSRYMASKNEWNGLRKALVLGIFSNLLINVLFFKDYGLLASSFATAISFWVCGFTIGISNRNLLSKFFVLPKITDFIK